MYIEDETTKKTALKRIAEHKKRREQKKIIKELIYNFLGALILVVTMYISIVLTILIFG